jgi:hypothetical protein
MRPKPPKASAILKVYGPRVLAMPSNKPRDPEERAELLRRGDKAVLRETDGLTKLNGERPTRRNSR